MFPRIRCSQASRALKDFQFRRHKTTTGTREEDLEEKFLPPETKFHLFGCEHQSNETPSIHLDQLKSSCKTLVLPDLCGTSIQSHIEAIAEKQYGNHNRLLLGLSTISCPSIPNNWVFQSGWTCYKDGCDPQAVEYPNEDALFFDAEICVRESFAPVLATAVSSNAWYSWVSPRLVTRSDQCGSEHFKNLVQVSDLISIGDCGSKPRVVVGHYVCFDSARVQECYNLHLSGLRFFDTMAAHISVSGITDLQRYFILNASEKPTWAELACGNSLSQLYRLYCGSDLDKTERDVFVKGSLTEIADRFQELCTYCALDVKATHSVFCELFPLYMARFQHKATLGALMEISSMYIPVSANYKNVVESAKKKSTDEDEEVKLLLKELARDALELQKGGKYKRDPWMWDQDWSIPRKKKVLKDPDSPEWYQKLIVQMNSSKEDDVLINFRRNIAAKLMQLCWGNYPLHYERNYGWGMLMPALKESPSQKTDVPVESIRRVCNSIFPRVRITSDPSFQDFILLQSGITAANSALRSGVYSYKEENPSQFFIQNGLLFKKLPHYLSLEKNVGGVLSTSLLSSPCLRSSNPKAQRILEILRKNIFWKRNGKALETLPVAWYSENPSWGACVPSASAFGDFRRIPKELLFSAFCCEVSGGTGMEVGEAFKAPPGWCFLSTMIPHADLWITSLLADSKGGKYCATPIGQMFAEGSVYENISKQLRLTTSQAELVFHAVVWGANKRYLAKVLRDINPVLGEITLFERVTNVYEYMYGNPEHPKFREVSICKPGGILADFQVLIKELSKSKIKATPFLHSRLSRVLEEDGEKFFFLIQNWLVRSSVADYLHVLMLCFQDLQHNARLCTISQHNLLIKYLIPEREKYHAAKSLHIANMYSAAFCAAQVGLSDVPMSAAKLPFVTLSSHLREDNSVSTQTLTFEQACAHSLDDSPTVTEEQ